MGHRSWVKEMREDGSTRGLCALVFICITFFWSPMAGADPGSAEPQRSYGAIDVIMYQTSW